LSEIDPRRYLLSEAAARRIFEEEILPEELAGTPQAAPCVVFAAGQPGAGKTTTTETVVDRLRAGHDNRREQRLLQALSP
jgi:UDP-N-acetylglucosamine kinase